MSMNSHNPQLYSGRRLAYSMSVALLLLLIPWMVHLYAEVWSPEILKFGLRPQEFKGLLGIGTMHFLHGGIDHLMSNSVPFFVLTAALFFYYHEVAWKVLGWIALMTGVGLWFIGVQGSNHIGASGLVYGLVGFHLTSGIIRRNRNLTAFAFLVVFLYGGFIWSIFPDFFPDKNISWEGHLTGLISGIVLALVCRKCGPAADPAPDDLWDDEDENEDAHDFTDDESSALKESISKPQGGYNTSSTAPGGSHVRYPGT